MPLTVQTSFLLWVKKMKNKIKSVFCCYAASLTLLQHTWNSPQCVMRMNHTHTHKKKCYFTAHLIADIEASSKASFLHRSEETLNIVRRSYCTSFSVITSNVIIYCVSPCTYLHWPSKTNLMSIDVNVRTPHLNPPQEKKSTAARQLDASPSFSRGKM